MPDKRKIDPTTHFFGRLLRVLYYCRYLTTTELNKYTRNMENETENTRAR